MRPHRPLLVGCLLASITVVAYAAWQMLPNREGAFGRSATEYAAPQDDDVLNSSDDKSQEDRYVERRRSMVQKQLAARDITDKRVLEAMQRVPRHLFVPKNQLAYAYADGALPIGLGQTISQPYIVALMSQLARTNERSVALDVGTGSGYQAAVLAELCDKVYSIEIVETLAKSAKQRLTKLGYKNVTVRHGDGYRGWEEHAPFDVIIVAAAPKHVPQPLIEQLKVGGRLIIPVGDYHQVLIMIEKKPDGSTEQKRIIPVAFVPMTGEATKNKRGKD